MLKILSWIIERDSRVLPSIKNSPHFENKIVILDDQKYSTLSNLKMKGYDGFGSDNFNAASNNVKYKEKTEFESEISVWHLREGAVIVTI